MRKSERFFFPKKKNLHFFFFSSGKKRIQVWRKIRRKKVTPYFLNKHLDDQDVWNKRAVELNKKKLQ